MKQLYLKNIVSACAGKFVVDKCDLMRYDGGKTIIIDMMMIYNLIIIIII